MYFFVKTVNIKRSEACGKINAVSLTAFMGKVLFVAPHRDNILAKSKPQNVRLSRKTISYGKLVTENAAICCYHRKICAMFCF